MLERQGNLLLMMIVLPILPFLMILLIVESEILLINESVIVLGDR